VADRVVTPLTRGDALRVARDAHAALALVAETVADEWVYVSRLTEAGRAHLARAAGPRPEVPLDPDAAAAVDAAAAEALRITDPHRAIDWLSTFPAVIELALGGDAGGGGPRGGPPAGPGEPAGGGPPAGPVGRAGAGPGA
jgi:hypothetical protein